MLKREPPDGKEKPEPPKIGTHKPETSHHTLSRKNSKSDLIERSIDTTSESSTPHIKAEKRDSATSKDQSTYLDSIKSTQQSFLEPLKDDDLERLKDW